MTYRLDVRTVREAARGHWDAIFCALAPTLKAAMQRPGKHVPCPVHGGKDGFRLFSDYEQAGSCVCNTCGTFRDGFARRTHGIFCRPLSQDSLITADL